MSANDIKVVDCRAFPFARVDIPVIMDSDLSTYEKMVYVALCTFASRANSCFPSVKTLAKAASCSARQVRRCLEGLEKRGLIRIHERMTEKGQSSNIYDILGAQGMTESQPPMTGSHTPPDSESPRTIFSELDTTSLSEKEEPPSDEALPSQENAEFVDIDEVPQVMRPTVEYFLLKTGRKGITPGELSAVKTLEKIHVPARVNQEIGKAVSRYEKKKRPLHTLTLEYIYESLKYQTSGWNGKSKTQRALTPDDPYEKQRASDLKEWESRQQQALLEKYGGDLE